MTMRRVLIIGGTGVFGKRLARHLVHIEGIEVVISSRSADKAEKYAEQLTAQHHEARVVGVALRTGEGLASSLARIAPFAVVDCSGPFQGAGYDTARTVLEAGAHFIDLADARDYLAGFTSALKDIALANGVAAVTGASSTPALSACVVHQIADDWRRVDKIDISITPGGKSEVGRSVIEAILSYAGRPVPVWSGGRLAQVIGWKDGKQVTVPGLGQRRVASVETYDAEYLGARHDVTSHIGFWAGLESRVEQRGLEWLASARAAGFFPRLKAPIPSLLMARKFTRLTTSDRGGMLVNVEGLDAEGYRRTVDWSLVARNDHGPYIPVLPAAATLRKLLRGDLETGACVADQVLSLDDILVEMTGYDIEYAVSSKELGGRQPG